MDGKKWKWSLCKWGGEELKEGEKNEKKLTYFVEVQILQDECVLKSMAIYSNKI